MMHTLPDICALKAQPEYVSAQRKLFQNFKQTHPLKENLDEDDCDLLACAHHELVRGVLCSLTDPTDVTLLPALQAQLGRPHSNGKTTTLMYNGALLQKLSWQEQIILIRTTCAEGIRTIEKKLSRCKHNIDTTIYFTTLLETIQEKYDAWIDAALPGSPNA